MGVTSGVLVAAPAEAFAPGREGEPSRAAARPSGCSSATTPRQAAGALCCIVRVAGPSAACGWATSAARGMFSTVKRGLR